MSVQEDIKKVTDNLKPHTLEFIKIQPCSTSPKHIWSSKFVGKPYWPKNKEYPSTKDGTPLLLLAQINFEEVPELKGYPTKGILQFFISDDDVYGLDFDTPLEETINNPDGYMVVYHPDVSIDLSLLENDLPFASESSSLPITTECSLKFNLKQEIPSPTDYRFEQYAGDIYEFDDEVSDYLYDNLDASGSKLGGYANFTQDDPRSYEKPKENWILLFQMDTEEFDGVDIMWGDCGVGNFFIQPESLSNSDFSKVWYNWDCC